MDSHSSPHKLQEIFNSPHQTEAVINDKLMIILIMNGVYFDRVSLSIYLVTVNRMVDSQQVIKMKVSSYVPAKAPGWISGQETAEPCFQTHQLVHCHWYYCAFGPKSQTGWSEDRRSNTAR